jgi:hypothetical protein
MKTTTSRPSDAGGHAIGDDENTRHESDVLLARDGDPIDGLSPPPRAAWQRLGGRTAHFGPGGLTDSGAKYASWFERLNASVVLIRPDVQVFGGVLDASPNGGPGSQPGRPRPLPQRPCDARRSPSRGIGGTELNGSWA